MENVAQWLHNKSTLSLLFALALPTLLVSRRILRRNRRLSILPKHRERVLVLGASSGIGRSIAHLYAQRGAHVCIVGRRQRQLEAVEAECVDFQPNSRDAASADARRKVISAVADFINAEHMVRVRTIIETEWKGVDTVIVSAGVSALRPVMELAGVERVGSHFVPAQPSSDAIQAAADTANAATRANFIGPLVAALTFIPLLLTSSPSPSLQLISSLAALVPAPTRALYASTKSASLLLYQALAIEHPSLAVSLVVPSTVQGDFRASAVDGGPVRESDPNKSGRGGGLEVEGVARRCVGAVDAGERVVWMPWWFGRVSHAVYWIWPSLVERMASRKYNFVPS